MRKIAAVALTLVYLLGVPLLALLTSHPIARTVLATVWSAAFTCAFIRVVHAPTSVPVFVVTVATAAFALYLLATMGTASFGSPVSGLGAFWQHFEVSHAFQVFVPAAAALLVVWYAVRINRR